MWNGEATTGETRTPIAADADGETTAATDATEATTAPPTTTTRRARRATLALALGAWVVLVGAGFAMLLGYSFRPGRGAAAGASWPAASRVPRERGRPTLVMVAHPQCPCTRASLAELERLMTRLGGRADAHVLFVRPAGAPAGWNASDLYRRASRIPGVAARWDDGGREAALFGARTSGHVALYAADGRLLFDGGITSGRGHEGDNLGAAQIVTLVEGEPATRQARAPVYGCGLDERNEAARGEGPTWGTRR